jgi:hypothetical protein
MNVDEAKGILLAISAQMKDSAEHINERLEQIDEPAKMYRLDSAVSKKNRQLIHYSLALMMSDQTNIVKEFDDTVTEFTKKWGSRVTLIKVVSPPDEQEKKSP